MAKVSYSQLYSSMLKEDIENEGLRSSTQVGTGTWVGKQDLPIPAL